MVLHLNVEGQMRLWFITLGLSALAPSLQAQATAVELRACAAIGPGDLRLSCYDNLSKSSTDVAKPSETAVPQGSSRLGNWIMTKRVDPITDQYGVSFLLLAEGAAGFDNPSLSIRCQRGELDVILNPDAYLGSDNDRVTVRFGTDQPTQQRWTASTDHRVLFAPGKRDKVELFVRSLGYFERVAFQVKPYQKGPRSMTFDLTGKDEVLQELKALCPMTTQ